jgi:hypothetical protein
MTSKVDTDNLPPDEARIARMYGNRRPLNPVDRFRQAKRKQYFDSGDYAVAQSGKQDAVTPGALGQQHPSPETIPHPATPTNVAGGGAAAGLPKAHTAGQQPHAHQQQQSSGGAGAAGSPVKETSFLSRETSADDVEAAGEEGVAKNAEEPANENESGEKAQEEGAAASEGESLPIRT